jgi:DNA-binding transcriptional ArsR family regulator
MKPENPAVCEIFCSDKKKVSAVKRKMKSGPVFLRLADTFSILGNATRLKIIFALSQQELCVCDLAILLETTKSAVSHQLRLLRNARLVKYRREGKMSFYALDDEHIGKLFNQGLRHVKECPPRIRR